MYIRIKGRQALLYRAGDLNLRDSHKPQIKRQFNVFPICLSCFFKYDSAKVEHFFKKSKYAVLIASPLRSFFKPISNSLYYNPIIINNITFIYMGLTKEVQYETNVESGKAFYCGLPDLEGHRVMDRTEAVPTSSSE